MTDWTVNGYVVLNALLSIAIVWVCICRITSMDSQTTRPLFRLAYVGILTAALGNGASYWFFPGERVGPGTLMISAAMLGHLFSTFRAWRRGVPNFAKSDHVSLEEVVG